MTQSKMTCPKLFGLFFLIYASIFGGSKVFLNHKFGQWIDSRSDDLVSLRSKSVADSYQDLVIQEINSNTIRKANNQPSLPGVQNKDIEEFIELSLELPGQEIFADVDQVAAKKILEYFRNHKQLNMQSQQGSACTSTASQEAQFALEPLNLKYSLIKYCYAWHRAYMDADATTREKIKAGNLLVCSNWSYFFDQADVAINHSIKLIDELKTTKSEVVRKDIIDELQNVILLSGLNATESERIRILELDKTIQLRQEEIKNRIRYYYTTHIGILMSLSVSGIISLILLLVMTGESWLENPIGEDGENQDFKKLARKVFLINLFFFLFFWQVPEFLRIEENFMGNLSAYQKYIELENRLRSYIATGSYRKPDKTIENADAFDKPEVNRFILYVEDQLNTIDQYAILVNSGVLRSRLNHLAGLGGMTEFFDEKLQNREVPVQTNSSASDTMSSTP